MALSANSTKLLKEYHFFKTFFFFPKFLLQVIQERSLFFADVSNIHYDYDVIEIIPLTQ